ncbi:MAG TPA: FAD:protein FMN transferase [Gammaproteobacteria bacterium]|nr:FAD:protein FMN transferase [Gammaproteobacteria bacterium]
MQAKTLLAPARRRGTASGLAVIALALALAGCGNRADSDYQRQFFAFGTLVDITIYGASTKLAQQASDQAERQFERMHRSWHAWHPSDLTRTNRLLATGKPFTAPASVLPLITLGKTLSDQSGGLFDPAIGRLLGLWGFESDQPPEGPPPDPKRIAALVARHPSMDDIHVDGSTVRCSNPAVQLDFGAYAKGYGVDQVIAGLRKLGIRNAIVNAGGDLRAIGRHGDRPWRIGIMRPRGPGVIASVKISGDQSVFTSGDYERYYMYKGKRYHHILDPRTGYPAWGTRSVTVIDRDGARADAAATALFVAGPKGWVATARRMGIHYVMLIDKHGIVHMNPAMAKRIHFETPTRPKVELSPPL